MVRFFDRIKSKPIPNGIPQLENPANGYRKLPQKGHSSRKPKPNIHHGNLPARTR
jgi:hypothetical protein